MRNIKKGLGTMVGRLSEQTYEQSLASYRLWLEIEQTYSEATPDLIFNAIWEFRACGPSPNNHAFVNPIAPLILRFVDDVESDSTLAVHSAGLRNRLCAMLLEEFFDAILKNLYSPSGPGADFFMDVNLIAHCANLGYIREATIHNHILQSLSHPMPMLRYYQAKALCILFKIAGATFDAYADAPLVDHCFERLRKYTWNDFAPEANQMQVSELWERSMAKSK